MTRIVRLEDELWSLNDPKSISAPLMLKAKQFGFSDRQLALIWNLPEMEVCELRKALNFITPLKSVDTCAAEFETYYSTYEQEDETRAISERKRIVILGGGPNRIGQGIEFDYCCSCHASFALTELGYESVMGTSPRFSIAFASATNLRLTRFRQAGSLLHDLNCNNSTCQPLRAMLPPASLLQQSNQSSFKQNGLSPLDSLNKMACPRSTRRSIVRDRYPYANGKIHPDFWQG